MSKLASHGARSIEADPRAVPEWSADAGGTSPQNHTCASINSLVHLVAARLLQPEDCQFAFSLLHRPSPSFPTTRYRHATGLTKYGCLFPSVWYPYCSWTNLENSKQIPFPASCLHPCNCTNSLAAPSGTPRHWARGPARLQSVSLQVSRPASPPSSHLTLSRGLPDRSGESCKPCHVPNIHG